MLNRLLVAIFAGGLLPLGAGFWWPLELSSHFRLQYLVVALTGLAAALLYRRKRLAVALAASMALNAWPVVAFLRVPATSVSGEPFTILNLNVNARNSQHDRVLERIRSSGADLVTVVELSPALESKLDALATDYPYHVTVVRNDNFGLGVLSRYPLGDVEEIEVGTAPAISVLAALPAGRLRLLAVHLKPPLGSGLAAERNRQLNALAQQIRTIAEPLVVCGDFNLSPNSPYFTEFESSADVRAASRGQGLRMSWPAGIPILGLEIDHCFLREGIATESIETMDQIGSDHYPVRVRLRWRGQE